MFHRHKILAMCSAMIALGATDVVAAPKSARVATPVKAGETVQINDLRPFTHIAYIPSGADLSSIKIENAKVVNVATKVRSVTDAHNCAEGEDGNAPSCTRTAYESYVPGVRVTYSYIDESTPWEGYGTTYSFSVYFRMDEMNPGLRRALAKGKIGRNAAAEMFEVSTARGLAQEDEIDEANSTLCDGYYVDDHWMHADPKCEDRVTYRKVASPSPYITVKIDPAVASSGTAVAAIGPWEN